MKYNRKRLAFILLSMYISTMFIFCSCGKKEEEPPTLWVLTEKTEWDGMNSQLDAMTELFLEEYPNFQVNIDILPQEEPGRSLYMQRLRTLTAAGKGPDVFLLPTSATEHGRQYANRNIGHIRDLEPLFADVEITMCNGIFADIHTFYEADIELKTEELNKQIMDAGCYRGGRYILPLRYSFPVLYTDVEKLAEYGYSLTDISGNINQLLNWAIASGNQAMACSAEPAFLRTDRGFSLLDPQIDYESETISATKEEVASFLYKIQDLESLIGSADEHRYRLTIYNFTQSYYDIWSEEGFSVGKHYEQKFPIVFPCHIGFLEDAALVTAAAKASGENYAMLPLKNNNGDLNAFVTYYGAVGAGSDHLQEAYDFLRLFLTENAQFERARPIKQIVWDRGIATKTRLIEEGWPVRIWNATDAIWSNLRTSVYWAKPDEDAEPVKVRKFITMHLQDRDLPLLNTKFDNVYFGNALEQDFAQMVRSLNDPITGEPTDADIDAMAEEFIKKLEWQLLEG